MKRAQAVPEKKGQWWTDIISDSNGPSFHRLQAVIWTLILGGIFAFSVATEAEIGTWTGK